MRKLLLTITAIFALSILTTGCGESKEEIALRKRKERISLFQIKVKLFVAKSSCESFYSEYYQYPISLDELKGKGKVDFRKIDFLSGDISDDWTSDETDLLGIMVDSDSDGTADTCIKGFAENINNIKIPKGVPVFVFTGKGGSDNTIVTSCD